MLFRSQNCRFRAPRRPVYSCTTARPFPDDPEAIRELAIAHWAEPVRFSELIRNLYDDGVRLFVESGPRGNLSAFAEDVLRGLPFVATPANVPRRSGLTQLNHLLAALLSHHVPLNLGPLYEHRAPRKRERLPGAPAPSRTLNAALPPERPRLDVLAAAPAPEAPESTAHRPGGDLRSQVMARHLEVMGRFVDHQREITELFLTRTRRQREAPIPPARIENYPTNGEAARTPGRPLLGAFTQHEPGSTLVMRRVLDLREDHFATHHTVGGREISKADPEQYGVPVMPMTFTLEMMAEAAAVLVPGQVVISVRDVRLFRWLAYNEETPTVVELTARVEPRESTDSPWRVTVEVRDLGLADRPKETAWLAAEGTVVLAAAYPPAPPCLPFHLTNEGPATLSVERTYHNLFHGPLFQGVRANLRSGDEGIESRVEVLPRDRDRKSVV